MAAGFIAFMAVCCIPNLVRAMFAPFWAKVEAEVVSSSTGYLTRSVQGTEQNESVPFQTVRVAYSYRNRSYEQALSDAHTMLDTRKGDRIAIRVCPHWPSWTCREEASRLNPMWYIASVLFWGGLTWGFLWAAAKAWNHSS